MDCSRMSPDQYHTPYHYPHCYHVLESTITFHDSPLSHLDHHHHHCRNDPFQQSQMEDSMGLTLGCSNSWDVCSLHGGDDVMVEPPIVDWLDKLGGIRGSSSNRDSGGDVGWGLDLQENDELAPDAGWGAEGDSHELVGEEMLIMDKEQLVVVGETSMVGSVSIRIDEHSSTAKAADEMDETRMMIRRKKRSRLRQNSGGSGGYSVAKPRTTKHMHISAPDDHGGGGIVDDLGMQPRNGDDIGFHDHQHHGGGGGGVVVDDLGMEPLGASSTSPSPHISITSPSNRARKLPQYGNVIHVRARRGQATDRHSIAERIRRDRINQRMKLLQDLLPNRNQVLGKAAVLDEIINYVKSLQLQIDILSLKLAATSPANAIRHIETNQVSIDD